MFNFPHLKKPLLLGAAVLGLAFSGAAKASDAQPLPPEVIQAVKSQNLAKLKVYFESGIPADFKVEGDWTPLHFAADTGNAAIGKFLIEMGANVNAETLGGEIPLHRAVLKASVPFVKLLLANKSKTNVSNAGDHTPLDVAVSAMKASKDKNKIKAWQTIIALLKAKGK